jgi:LacI family transcriptional regulator
MDGMMKKRATLNDIAKALNVNPSTVSRALNPSTSQLIGAEQRLRIEEMAKEMNYQPKLSARSLATSKSYSIGLALRTLELDFASPYFALLLASLSRKLYTKGYSLTILPVMNEESRDEEILQYLKIGRVDGFLISSSLVGEKTLEFLEKEKTPVVFWEHFGYLEERFNIVRTDDAAGAEQLVEALWELGHRKTVYMMPDYCSEPLMRFQCYQNAWSKRGHFFNDSDIVLYKPKVRGHLADRHEARKAAEEYMDKLLSYSAIVCVSDLVAFGVIDALEAKGICIGRDISVIGYDNLEGNPNYKSEKPFLATILKDTALSGDLIADMLIDRIAESQLKAEIKEVPSTFIKRESLGKVK